MKIFVVVAHPDDHVLWIGGTIIRFNEFEWHVLSLCNSHNDNFGPKRDLFKNSCDELGCGRYKALEMRDYQPRELMEVEQMLKMQKEILAFADSEYDLIFTHSSNPNCEYGFHANHAEAREATYRLINEGLLKTNGIGYFSYKSGGINQPVIADMESGNYKVVLTSDEIAKKRSIKQIFTWAQDDLQNLSLWNNDEPKVEAFKIEMFNNINLPSGFEKI